MRRRIVIAMMMVCLLGSVASCSGKDKEDKEKAPSKTEQTSEQPSPSAEASLTFNPENYTEESETVTTVEGEKKVTYRYYKHICYVAKPVDTAYQSMDIKIPVKIDDQEIDASTAPILFANSVGGYLSAGNAGTKNDFTENIINKENAQELTRNNQLALAAGYVVVEPGCRGRENEKGDGTYYGKAPAGIVDLKAAVRYLKYNDKKMPGNADFIISTGTSAGGAMSALLGVSGNSNLYEAALNEIGAAEADDSIFACASFCPITDLQHADMAYEWMFGSTKLDGKEVDQSLSNELQDQFSGYLEGLNLQGKNESGTLTASNYEHYLLEYYLQPSATKYLEGLSNESRTKYLKKNRWIIWKDEKASFTFADYVSHIGRSKSLPAFDSLDASSAENILFGNETMNARHFTLFSINHSDAEVNATIDDAFQTTIDMMNPMFFLKENEGSKAKHWWIRYGSSDTNTSLPVIIDLATALENDGEEVNTLLYWDAGHGANLDAEDFMTWISDITGYSK